MSMMQEMGSLSINSENLFPIIKKWLYSDKDIFIREIVSNAVDAIQKHKHLVSLGEANESDDAYRVSISVNKEEKTITVSDNGIGMTADEVKKYINQIAFSGASEFLEKYKDAAEDPIIGHFGLGFYSAFMVSELVEIQTLSFLQDAEPVHWSCDGTSSYTMEQGTRTGHGTDIILHVNEDGEKYLDLFELRQIAEKYCSFMSIPIYLSEVKPAAPESEDKAENADASAASAGAQADGEASAEKDAEAKTEEKKEAEKPINDPTPLYLKAPKDCTDEEYKEFYRKTFFDFKEPLFWIHLNMDYPYNLKGILYFPKLASEFESAEGQVKLYCNQVFVADNVKEIIPEFLLLLKGVIDCPDIPLNVSRSYLQNDAKVKRISEYITRKVADKLNQLFKDNRPAYEKYWGDIHPFIKYGCLRNDKFYDRIKDILVFKLADQEGFETLQEYLDKAKESHENKIFYADNVQQQARYISLLKQQSYETVELPTAIDVPFISMMETKVSGLKFVRVDADLSSFLKKENAEEISKEDQESIEKTFRFLLHKDDLKVRAESLKDVHVAAMIELSEDERRFAEMMKMYGQMGMGGAEMPAARTLVVNKDNRLVQYVLDHTGEEKAETVAAQIYDLARLSNEPLSAEDLNTFLTRSASLLEEAIG